MSESKNGPFKRIGIFFADERVRVVLGLFIFLFACLVLFSFISYLFTWKADQSFQFQEVLSNAKIQSENWAGKFGARISNIFVFKLFGISSFLIPVIIVFLSLELVAIKIFNTARAIKKVIIFILLSSFILSYLFGTAGGYLGSGPGGYYGYFIIELLNSIIGQVGTGLMLFILVFTYIVFSFPGTLEYIKSIFAEENIDQKESGSFNEVEHQDNNNIEEEINQSGNETYGNEESNSSNEFNQVGFEVSDHEKNEEELSGENQNEHDKESIEEEGVGLTIEQIKEEEEKATMVSEDYDPTLDLSHFKLPPLDLLEDHEKNNTKVTDEELVKNKDRIVETLNNYKIDIKHINATIGPTVTLYEIIPAPGIRISKIKNLEDDIALSLAALGIRIIAPIPGRGTIGIEVPNSNPQVVSMRSLIGSSKFVNSKAELPVALGKTVSNENYIFDLAKAPHLLVAGATGQGKSVGLNAILSSLLYKKHPSQIKFVLIDPKKVELSVYSRIETHYLAKLPDTEEAIITDVTKVVNTLNSLCIEMDARYDMLKKAKVRSIKEYNEKFIKRKLNPEKGFDYLPYIVLIIDEFADLIMTAGKEIETPIARLAQLARAVGIHLIVATQRPSTNVITGIIKANFPARVAFRTTSMIDSRTILDSPGANQLIGRGDMLISMGSDMVRLQCALVDTPEIDKIIEFISDQQGYPTAFELPEYVPEDGGDSKDVDLSKRDGLFEQAARLVVSNQQGSTSLIQRKFSVGYNRAGRIMDQLEMAGVVGPSEGSKARQVLIMDELSLEKLLNDLDNL